MPAIVRRVERLLADGPLRRAEIVRRLEIAPTQWNGVGVYLDLVRVPPMGTWERPRADLYALAESWIGPSTATEPEGRALLAKRYFAAFGPATGGAFATWAGLSVREATATLEGIRLRRFRGEDGKPLLDLPRAPLPDPDTPAPVRFLPVWDATLLAHARRTQILPERHRERVFNVRTPQSLHTFLVDGQVAGTWRFDDGRVRVEPFGRLSREVRREVDDEAERLAALMR
jgi:hypothetical protein